MNGEKINLVPDVSSCSGCGACIVACPKAAIRMKEAADGCKYPVIDPALCVGCRKCLKVCAYRQEQSNQLPLAAYAAVGKDEDVVKNSTSGGVFASLALSWIRSGGLVAGAVMNLTNGVQVYHILSEDEADIRRMQGSKYVQSDAWRCYAPILEALKNGRRVLFSGTPCQVAAIKKLTGNPDNLTTIDLICHGVPPVKMLKEYVCLLEKRFLGKIVSFTFRDKSARRNFCARLDIQRAGKKQKLYVSSSMLSFYKHFLQGTTYRGNCYTCPFARIERISDLTVGDYWGIKAQHADAFASGMMPEREDWSCLLVNTAKGNLLLSEYGGKMDMFRSNAEAVANENHQLRHPTRQPSQRTELLKAYAQDGYAAIEKQFVRSNGGVRYYVRLLKQLRQNARKVNEGI